ncbi:cytidine deaminase [soil metagenome]
MTIENSELVRAAIEAKNSSYSPYSKFRVGAALLTKDNKIYKGANIENASYSLCICAERVAFVKALTEGSKEFSKIAIATDDNDFATPCGSCRQFMSEFTDDLEVILVVNENLTRSYKLSELFPNSFKLKH